MSCDNPPGSTEAVMRRRRKFDKTGICIKCKTDRGRLVIRHAVYCKACFVALVTSKFRQVLDPTINSSNEKLPIRGSLKASGNLMIGFSGGLGSTVLLDLIKSCYFSSAEATNKGGKNHPRKSGRPWDRVIVCYVECCGGYRMAVDRTPDIAREINKYHDLFEFLPMRLEDAFMAPQNVCVNLSSEDLPICMDDKSDAPAVALLGSYLASLPTKTSRQSSISSLIRLLLQHTARTHACSHLLLGTSLTSLSVNLIDAVACGAGFTVGLEKAEDWQSPDLGMVRVVRPLREISMKECAAYTHWRDLSVVGNLRILSTPSNDKESIGRLTKDFIYGLERDYPSTVSTIVRTCDKLVSNTAEERCVLCERPAQPGVQEWKERISIRNMIQNGDKPLEKVAEVENNQEWQSVPKSHLTPRLCYACHTTLTSRSTRGARRTKDMDDGIQNVPLPTWVGRNLEAPVRLQTRAAMMEQIQEFIIDSDDAAT